MANCARIFARVCSPTHRRGLEAITLGKLRQSNISRMCAAGIAAAVVAAWHGHTERMIQAVYGRVTDERLTAAADVFSSAVRGCRHGADATPRPAPRYRRRQRSPEPPARPPREPDHHAPPVDERPAANAPKPRARDHKDEAGRDRPGSYRPYDGGTGGLIGDRPRESAHDSYRKGPKTSVRLGTGKHQVDFSRAAIKFAICGAR